MADERKKDPVAVDLDLTGELGVGGREASCEAAHEKAAEQPKMHVHSAEVRACPTCGVWICRYCWDEHRAGEGKESSERDSENHRESD